MQGGIKFSEFSYGYAVTAELSSGKLGRLLGAPIFPSLFNEGQTGGGYDVKIPYGVPLFVQFKLSDYLVRSNALERKVFNSPYFRMHLRPLRYSLQHNLLMDLERTNRDSVFYLAPEFYKAEELNEAYLNTNVLRKSAPFSPLDIGSLPDDGPHYVVFCASVKYAYRRSESRKLLERSHSGEDFLEHQLMRARRDKVETNGAFFDRITRGILDVIEGRQVLLQSAQATHLWEEAERRETRQEKAQFAAYLSRAYLDTELFVLSEQDN